MLPTPRTIASTAAIAAILAFASSARALTPDQIAVIINPASEGSKKVADHYLAARKIPAENVLTLTIGAAGWTEAYYRDEIVHSLRQQLKDKKIDDKIQCLVTTFDVPLAIPAVALDADAKAEIAGYRQSLGILFPKLEAGLVAYEKIAPNAAATTTSTAPATTSAPASRPAPRTFTDGDLQKLQQKILAAAKAAIDRVKNLPPQTRAAAMQTFIENQTRYFGPAGVLPFLAVSGDSSQAQQERRDLEQMRAQLAEDNQLLANLLKAPPTPASRRQILTLRIKNGGLMGEAAQSSLWMSEAQQPDSSACLDSELALLWEDNYPRARWIPNPDCLDVHPYIGKTPGARIPRILMTSRLDGLTPDAVIGMIDTTLRVEKTGLTGVCYFDARGLTANDAYSAYDADIRKAADYLRQNSSMKVVLENTPELLQAQDAPDAALYCGWYSLRKYIDSCQWNPGFVGYHVASLEMLTLHHEDDRGWVPNLLRHQCAGTLGAVEEPYLNAFPKPSQFFPLLMTGKFTQGEVYLLTNPLLSWRIGYVGDPLYNPFAAQPALASEKILANTELKPAFEILRSLHLGPTPPAATTTTAPKK